jgi:hypothetical protein
MFRNGQVELAVAKFMETVFERPEVQGEIKAIIEASVRDGLEAETKRIIVQYFRGDSGYSNLYRDSVRDGIVAWIAQHKDEIQVMVDTAARESVNDTTVYNTVAKEQFGYYLSKMVGPAIEKEMAYRTKKAAKAAKKR